MKRFDLLLKEDVSGYKGDFSELIHEAPALYRLMTRLLSDPGLPEGLSPLVISAIAYFIAPADIIPEEQLGPRGYVDDIYFCAFVADQVMRAAGTEDILTGNWDGERPVVPLVKEILSREKELIEDKKELIMEYIGYDQLNNLAKSDNID